MADINLESQSPVAIGANDAAIVRRGTGGVNTGPFTAELVQLGDAATKATGTTAGTVAAGDHTHTAAAITDFATAVAATPAVTANTAKVSNATHTGDVTGATALTIANDAVTFSKMQNIATDSLIGRDTASTGDPEAITVTGGIEFSGAGSIRTSAFTGDVTKTAGGTALTIAANAVDNTKAADMAANTVKVRAAGTTGDPSDIALAASQLLGRGATGDIAPIILGTNLSMTGTTLNASGGGGGVSDGDKGDITVSSGGTVWTVDADAITYAKFQNVGANSILARADAASGDVGEVALSASELLGRGSTGNVAAITLGSGLSMSGTTLSATGGGSTTITAAPATDQADWNPAGFGSSVGTVIMQPTTNSFIGGIAAGAANQVVQFVNDSLFVVCFITEDSASTAANRIDKEAYVLWVLPQESVTLRYSSTLSRWVRTDKSQLIYRPSARSQLFLPSSGTTVNSLGLHGVGTATTISTVVPALTPTNDFTAQSYWQMTNGTVNAASNIRGNVLGFYRGSVAGFGGFFHTGRVRFTAMGAATGSVYSGMHPTTSSITAAANTLLNCLLVCATGAQTTLRVRHGNGASATEIDLGANFPVPNATASYEYAFFAPNNSAFVRYMVRRMDTRFVAEGSITTNLPVNNQGLAHAVGVTVGATAATNTAQCSFLITQGL